MKIRITETQANFAKQKLIKENKNYIKAKLLELINSGTVNNIQLAAEIAKGQGIDLDSLISKGFNLKYWRFYLNWDDKVSDIKLLEHIFTTTYLGIVDKGLKKSPKGIDIFKNLTWLDFNGNYLTNIDDSVCNIESLDTMLLQSNKLTTLPIEIGNLNKLTHLDVSNNKLLTLPESIGNLLNLKVLNLRNNQLDTLPETLFNLPLRSLSLSGNPLPFEFKEEFRNHCKKNKIGCDLNFY